MAMGRRDRERQQSMWVAAADLPVGASHPFYARMNKVFAAAGFDAFAEKTCEPFYSQGRGRPGIAPGVYFRMLLIGYFEGLDSERGIAWRCQDSLALREFLGFDLSRSTPDHSTLSVIRTRLDLDAHQAVFDFVLKVLRQHGLVEGKTVGVDSTTLEANAAMRSIVRRDGGETYRDFLLGLARASGIEAPTQEDAAKLDRDRPNKGSNDDWVNPNDPDARITKMKDGQTHLAHKAEHAVDMDTGAVLAVTVQGADLGDTQTLDKTLSEVIETLSELTDADQTPLELNEVVADKGYHSNAVLTDLREMGIRTCIAEPKRGRRRWKDKAAARRAVYANRRRLRGVRGKRLQRMRGERVERTFAHHYETGAMRRTHLRGHENISKRLLVHSAGMNLGLLMRRLCGIGKPKALQDGLRAVAASVRGHEGPLTALMTLLTALWPLRSELQSSVRRSPPIRGRWRHRWQLRTSSTGC
jgi:transposase